MEILTAIKAGTAIIGGYLLWAIGGVNQFLILLFWLVCFDIFTGLGKAIYNKSLSSSVMFKGGYKKLLIFILIVIGNQIDVAFPDLFIKQAVTIYYIIQEGLSILENISQFINVPPKLKEFFKKLEGEDNEKNSD